MPPATKATATKSRGEIVRGVCYPLPLLMEKTGLGRKSIAKLRRNGMPVRQAGRNRFVLGDDFLDALIGE